MVADAGLVGVFGFRALAVAEVVLAVFFASLVWELLVVIFVFSAHFVELFKRKLVVLSRVDFFPAHVLVEQFFFRKFGHKIIIA